jgi:spermidine synthase
MLVDRWSAGRPDRAGTGYAVNVVGSIAGPLVAGFVLLPALGEHRSISVLVLPLFLVGVVGIVRPALVGGDGPPSRARWALVPVAAALAVIAIAVTRDFETRFPERQVRRDHTATVIATGSGMTRDLLVNGTPTTVLTLITKWMAHVPLASLEHRPTDALVICFGMGTTFRSLLSWDIRATAVELVPSVPQMFPYYHADAAELVRSPKARIVIDDGRRYLERSPDMYDVITIDPPNPAEAAGSSLLYSREFYAVARTRLRAGGILLQWVPAADVGTVASITRALAESFPHLRTFPLVNRRPEIEVLGVLFLASDRPIPRHPIADLARRLPPRAAQDLLEWPTEPTVEASFLRLMGFEVPPDVLTRLVPSAPALADDRPFNEYFLLRRHVLASPAPGL